MPIIGVILIKAKIQIQIQTMFNDLKLNLKLGYYIEMNKRI